MTLDDAKQAAQAVEDAALGGDLAHAHFLEDALNMAILRDIAFGNYHDKDIHLIAGVSIRLSRLPHRRGYA
jgi:hypothetical protein